MKEIIFLMLAALWLLRAVANQLLSDCKAVRDMSEFLIKDSMNYEKE